MVNDKFVAYYRVSTAKQGTSGLGLEAQEHAVLEYLNGGQWKLIQKFVEVESGRHNDRPELASALALCRIHNATLIIAKLDRLARNVNFISNLMESGVEFVAVDFPQANRLTVHILAAVAEHEAEMVSARTRAALAAAKARGVKLGGNRGKLTPQLAVSAAKASALVRKAKAQKRNTDLLPVIEAARVTGMCTLRAIAAFLNEQSIPAPRSGRWCANSVRRVTQSV
jgi:DNA invertase Pin-like site-specific DNA recombinase